MTIRNLTESEITTLKQRGCHAEDWNRILVAWDFSPGNSFHNVRFSGNIELGSCNGDISPGDSPSLDVNVNVDIHPLHNALFLPTGISDSILHNVSIGHNCRIHASTLVNVNVGSDAILEHVAELSSTQTSTFGNNLFANILTEDGARSIPLWRHLSAQVAHILCHCRHHPAAQTLLDIIDRDSHRLASARSHIGKRCLLRRTGRLRNVFFGDGAIAEDVGSLNNCHLEGGPAPACLGEGVCADSTIFLSASHATGGVRLERCLVGEGVRLEASLYAEHSVFFANSFFKLGEAVSLMAGPFTESHHRATLVLTCQSSFSTFGSGANASNHHFKLGPRHGGVLRRGTRCGSGSYLYWPCDIGAFSTVVGRHTEHLQTLDFPFSLIVSTGTGSVLVPGVHVFGIGVFRDAMKWRRRDRRAKVARPLDLVNSNVYSPYVMQAMERGLAMLRRSALMEGDLRHGGAVIPSQRVQPGIRLYESALTFYTGECLLRHSGDGRKGEAITADCVLETIREYTGGGDREDGEYRGGEWRDWGGMLVSGFDAEEFLRELGEGRVKDWEGVRERLEGIGGLYGVREVEWAAWRCLRSCGGGSEEGVREFFREWRKAVEFRAESLMRDAGKEFTPELAYGFGVEGAGVENFRKIRGEAVEEGIVREVIAERERLLELASHI